MDILIHTFSGIAAGTVISSFSKRGFLNKTSIILLGGLGGAFPDLDALSMYSKFDSTIGHALHLNHAGKDIYFSKFWYSHHAFLHSILGGLTVALILALIYYLFKSKFRNLNFKSFAQKSYSYRLTFMAFFIGFFIHLLEDMPTPSCTWGGVNLFFPGSSYIGGTGDIWWWNNYDLFLIIFTVIVLNIILLSLSRVLKLSAFKLTPIVFLIGMTFMVFQIKTRDFDFNYIGFSPRYNEFEAKSKQIQKKILGDKVYRFMEKLDAKIPLNF